MRALSQCVVGTDGRIALGANTPKQFVALLDTPGLPAVASGPEYFDEPVEWGAPAAFPRSIAPRR